MSLTNPNIVSAFNTKQASQNTSKALLGCFISSNIIDYINTRLEGLVGTEASPAADSVISYGSAVSTFLPYTGTTSVYKMTGDMNMNENSITGLEDFSPTDHTGGC